MKSRLFEAIENERAPHAILITGPEGSGKRALARSCASLYCFGTDTPQRLTNCPNYHEIGEGAVKVDDIRTLLASAAMQGFNGGRRAFLFLNAQNMSAQIQNTLLKTLEEPHSDILMILTGNEFGLLPTIRSRCLIERLGAGSIENTANELVLEGIDKDDAWFYAGLTDGILSHARAYANEDVRLFRSNAIDVLERAVFDYTPFSTASELVTIISAETEPEEPNEDETKGKGRRKRKKGDPALAQSLLDVFISAFRDALTETLGEHEPRNSDCVPLIRRIASCFTTAQIQGIIEMLASAQQKISAGASVYLTLDGVLAKLFYDK